MPSRTSGYWRLLMGGLLACGLATSGFAIHHLVMASFSVDFVETRGLVYDSRIEPVVQFRPEPEETYYDIVLDYRYRVASINHTGNRIYRYDLPRRGLEQAERIRSNYPAGQVVAVYYDPENPEIAVLHRGPSEQMWWLLLPGFLFTLTGASLALRSRQQRRVT